MQKSLLFGAIAALAFSANAAVNIDGIMYELNSYDNTAKVVAPSPANTNFYVGEIEIPETVVSNGTTYTVTTIGAAAFDMQWSCELIACPNSVTVIEAKAFNSPRVTDIILGNNVQQIGDESASAFPSSSSFSRLYIYNPVPPTLLPNQISEARRAQIMLIVPPSKVEAYQTAWPGFSLYYPDTDYDEGETGIPAESVTLSDEELNLYTGETATLTFTVNPADTTDIPSWTSSDEEVATVADGVVTAVALGNATITLTVGNVSATCEVNVSLQSGISEMTTDNAAPRYFNMQGIEIANPEKGQMVIVRSGNKAVKTIMK